MLNHCLCSSLAPNTMPTPPGWAANMAAVQTAIVAKNGFDWQNFRSIGSPKS